MSVEKVETLIVGGGQAGLAMSEQLSQRHLPHLVVERHRIAERWRSERWDGLHANGPAWHDRLPGLPIAGVGPDDFATRDQMVDYLVAYTERIAAPVRCGVAVTALHKQPDGIGFRAETSKGVIEANNVVAATGPFQRPVIPEIVPPETGPPETRIVQMHSSGYRNPGQLPRGAVLVVGAGSSGAQIADELSRAGRRVYLSVGRHGGLPDDIGGATSHGGSASRARGRPRSAIRRPGTSRSRSAAPMAATPSISGASRRAGWCCWARRKPSAMV